jgi:hypothetical protein
MATAVAACVAVASTYDLAKKARGLREMNAATMI